MKKQKTLAFLVKHLDHWPVRLGGAPVISGYMWCKSDDDLFLLDENITISTTTDDLKILRKEWLAAQLMKEIAKGITEKVKRKFIVGFDSAIVEPSCETVNTKPKQKIYIAGPMSTHPDFNRPAFNDASHALSMSGYIVLSPAILPDGLTQAEYMQIDLTMLQCCDAIYMLKGWDDSAGAMAEHALAMKLGLKVIHEVVTCQE